MCEQASPKPAIPVRWEDHSFFASTQGVTGATEIRWEWRTEAITTWDSAWTWDKYCPDICHPTINKKIVGLETFIGLQTLTSVLTSSFNGKAKDVNFWPLIPRFFNDCLTLQCKGLSGPQAYR